MCGEVADDLADVVYCGVEGPFAACSGQAAAGESSEAQVVFGVPERSFGDVGSLGVGGRSFGGAQPVVHRRYRIEVLGRRALGGILAGRGMQVAGFAGGG